jgi:hypothetical protein
MSDWTAQLVVDLSSGVGCTNTISLQIPDFTTREFVHATPSAELDASPGFRSSAECPTRTRGFLGPAGPERSDGQPLSFSASSVSGVSTRFRLQIRMIPRCEQSFGTPQELARARYAAARPARTAACNRARDRPGRRRGSIPDPQSFLRDFLNPNTICT